LDQHKFKVITNLLGELHFDADRKQLAQSENIYNTRNAMLLVSQYITDRWQYVQTNYTALNKIILLRNAIAFRMFYNAEKAKEYEDCGFESS
jgi:hypothetical protein